MTSRFLASVLKTSQQKMPPLPYARGARRAQLVAKRRALTVGRVPAAQQNRQPR